MTTVNFEEFNFKYYLRLHPEMLPVILFLGFADWLYESRRKLAKILRWLMLSVKRVEK